MLSEKKSTIRKPEIEFLGMNISNGQYRPGPHLAIQLLDFPDFDFNVKQVQQFLGIVNYIKDFIPHAGHYTSVLSPLLKKHPPSWSSCHIEVVIKLKKIAQSPPTLAIPSTDRKSTRLNSSHKTVSRMPSSA